MEKDVQQDSSPDVSEHEQTQEQIVEAPKEQPQDAATQTGSQTPSENLYAALREERDKRKVLEDKIEELQNLQNNSSGEDVYSDEGIALQKRIDSLQEDLRKERESREIEKLQEQYPALRDKSADFDQYRLDYPRHKLANVAKLFLAENNLLEPEPVRKGLEQATGGDKTPKPTGMTVQEAKDLRERNFEEYRKRLLAGELENLVE